jgi:LysR family transcriptional regulator, hydrogen peroxide-inducible genes activator
MKTSQIGYFLTLCEDLNFTKAAERCGVAQSTLTRAIKLLEMEFGGPLLRRERANTHLTELGRIIRPRSSEFRLALCPTFSRADDGRRFLSSMVSLSGLSSVSRSLKMSVISNV